MNKLLPLAFVAAGCVHVHPEPDDMRPLSDTEEVYIESRLAEPPSLKPEINEEITAVAREVAQCVFRDGKTREDGGDYSAELLILHQPDEADIIAEASVGSNGDVYLGLYEMVYDDQTRTRIVDRGIDGEADWYKFRSLCFLCPGPKYVKFKTAKQIRDEWQPQNEYEKMLRKIAARCKKGTIRDCGRFGPTYLHRCSEKKPR